MKCGDTRDATEKRGGLYSWSGKMGVLDRDSRVDLRGDGGCIDLRAPGAGRILMELY